MSNIQKWVAGAGVGLTYATAFNTADLTSLANGSWALSTITAIANDTNLDMYADVSFNLASLTTGSGSPYVALFILPLNQDGSTYGDGASAGATLPVASYLAGVLLVPPSVTAAINGTFRGIILPPTTFKFGFQNQTAAALSASTNAIKYRTYNEQNNG